MREAEFDCVEVAAPVVVRVRSTVVVSMTLASSRLGEEGESGEPAEDEFVLRHDEVSERSTRT